MKITMTEKEYVDHLNDYNGVCLACGEIRYGGCEPDADGYACDACGEMRVQGIEDAMLCENIEIEL